MPQLKLNVCSTSDENKVLCVVITKKKVHDAIVAGDGDPRDVGQKVVLPASFTGGPRYIYERQQDAKSYVRIYGYPELFITMTTNPK